MTAVLAAALALGQLPTTTPQPRAVRVVPAPKVVRHATVYPPANTKAAPVIGQYPTIRLDTPLPTCPNGKCPLQSR